MATCKASKHLFSEKKKILSLYSNGHSLRTMSKEAENNKCGYSVVEWNHKERIGSLKNWIWKGNWPKMAAILKADYQSLCAKLLWTNEIEISNSL